MSVKKAAASLAVLLAAAVLLSACNGGAATGNEPGGEAPAAPGLISPSGPSAMATDNPTETPSVRQIELSDFIGALSERDIAAAQEIAERLYRDNPGLGTVISVTFAADTDEGGAWLWYAHGEGLSDDDQNPKLFAPGNLAVFRIETTKYSDDQAALGRRDAYSEWEVINFGR
ncbi:MAG: hypothetical protein LBC78_01925 [Oscillospiraceae bacterium]|jgi:hypothetical protein|nr:hypothetical protein [Oscillospiraceae bacterium]